MTDSMDPSLPPLGGGTPPARRHRGKWSGLWHRLFADNRLVPIEAGFGEGRSRLRSPMTWLVLLRTAVPIAGLIFSLGTLASPGWLILFIKGQGTGSSAGAALAALAVVMILAVLFAVIWPLWLAAATWRRDIDPQRREQLATTLITPHHLIGAKTLIWMIPALAGIATQVLCALIVLAMTLISQLSHKTGGACICGTSGESHR